MGGRHHNAGPDTTGRQPRGTGEPIERAEGRGVEGGATELGEGSTAGERSVGSPVSRVRPPRMHWFYRRLPRQLCVRVVTRLLEADRLDVAAQVDTLVVEVALVAFVVGLVIGAGTLLGWPR
jgi:hypothetical protein